MSEPRSVPPIIVDFVSKARAGQSEYVGRLKDIHRVIASIVDPPRPKRRERVFVYHDGGDAACPGEIRAFKTRRARDRHIEKNGASDYVRAYELELLDT